MKNTALGKTILFSLLGHVAAFSIFSFSFGQRMPSPDYNSASFLGQVLSPSDLSTQAPAVNIRQEIMPRLDPALIRTPEREIPGAGSYYLRPTLNLPFNPDKTAFTPAPSGLHPAKIMQKPVIMLYPELPYNFLLYFKDRQEVHIELEFNILSSGFRKSIAIKRKISSGNLEADLLSMRYIGHYLFIEHSNFPQDSWQTVKIDLSTPK